MNQLVVVLDLIVLRNNLNVELYKCRSICSLIAANSQDYA